MTETLDITPEEMNPRTDCLCGECEWEGTHSQLTMVYRGTFLELRCPTCETLLISMSYSSAEALGFTSEQ